MCWKHGLMVALSNIVFERRGCIGWVGTCLLVCPATALGQAIQTGPQTRTFGHQLLFWFGAVALILFVGRHIFKEQINEHRTLRRLIKEVGPFYPEFDIDALKHWVFRCAPHVWRGWQTGSMAGLSDFATDAFMAAHDAHVKSLREVRRQRECTFERILKVHPLGMYMVGEGPAPRDVEMTLRLEEKGIDFIRDEQGKLVQGSKNTRQIQRFWCLRHDGHRWRLHQVWESSDDLTDLAQRPQVPVVTEWVRPESSV
ncbi:MAG: hypothetical protein VX589_14805 [Myxococcota bacterium]|nr:hypothetical protein [Myxococcota bacterium]